MNHCPNNYGSASGSRQTTITTIRTKNSGPCDRNFEQKLSDVGVFYSGNLLPGAGPIPKPEKFAQLRERVLRRRPSLSLIKLTNADYEAFERSLDTSKTEEDIMTNVIPIIEGTNQERGRSYVKKPFNNFYPLAAGKLCGTPDKCYGSNPADVLLEVLRELRDSIFPSTVENMPVAPNFFLELKSGFDIPTVVNRQALHMGALGERTRIALWAWRQDGSGLDKMAHTITSKYHDGTIILFSIHAEDSRIQDNRIGYYMNRIFEEHVDDGAESFRAGASAYRNLRDFAEEQKSQSINMANSMAQRSGDSEA